MDTRLTDEEIAQAVRLRITDGKYWDYIAAELETTRNTLFRARKTERWAEVALEVVEEIKAEAFPAAWQGLLDIVGLRGANTESARIAACKEILNRVDEVIEQKLRIYDGDARDKLDAKLAALADRRGEEGSD